MVPSLLARSVAGVGTQLEVPPDPLSLTAPGEGGRVLPLPCL